MEENDPGHASAADAPARRRSIMRAVTTLPRWKKVLLTVSLAAVVLGVGAGFIEGDAASGPSRASRNLPVGPTGLVDGRQPDLRGTDSGEVGRVPRPNGDAAAEDDPLWSPALVRGGLSFVVGFCLGIFMRSFIRLSAIVLGFAFLFVFLLSYMEVLVVDWAKLDGYFDTFVASAREEISEFRTFVTGSLPSVGAAGFGIFTGFKKDRR